MSGLRPKLQTTWSRTLRHLGAALLATGVLSGCVTNPATGIPELSLLSREDEIAMGAEGDAEIQSEFGLYDDSATAQYVANLGQAIAAKSDDPTLQWHFQLLDSPVVNAFALPGGYVYVTRGLLAHLQNEAQLAMVLGHEIGHVTARHAARQITGSQLAGLGVALTGALFSEVKPFLGLLQASLGLLELKYSRDDESWADELGVKYAIRAGYDATAGGKFFATLKRLEATADAGGLPVWFSTHPDSAERETLIPLIAERFRKENPSPTLGGTDASSFLPHLNGLIYGENPRQGFVKGPAFFHPELKFTFPVPTGWKLGNFPEQVQLAPPKAQGAGAVVLTIADGNDPAAVANRFAQEAKATVQVSQRIAVNGFPTTATKSSITVSSNGKRSTLAVLSYFIAKDGHVFSFHGVTTPEGYASLAPAFQSVFEGFDDLHDPAVLGVRPKRVTIIPATRSDTFQAMVPVSGDAPSLNDLAILNQVQPEDTVTAGAPLKLVQ